MNVRFLIATMLLFGGCTCDKGKPPSPASGTSTSSLSEEDASMSDAGPASAQPFLRGIGSLRVVAPAGRPPRLPKE